MSPRETDCGRTEASARLAKAREYLEVADIADVGEKCDAAAANAVLAGIAATDAICCLRLRRRSSSQRHDDAVELLARVDTEAASALRRLLAVRYKAQYDHRPVTASEATQALRRARQLLAAAEEASKSTP